MPVCHSSATLHRRRGENAAAAAAAAWLGCEGGADLLRRQLALVLPQQALPLLEGGARCLHTLSLLSGRFRPPDFLTRT
eukprot:COSAG01_NODE_13681_length_1548_cov_1.182069_1_plen_78_part_10